MKSKLLSLTIAAALFLNACAAEEKKPSLPTLPTSVKVLDLTEKPAYQIEEVGTLKAMKEVDLVAKSAGNIEQLSLKVGDTVNAGQMVALIGGEDKNNTAQVNYQNAQLQLSSAQQTLDENRANNQSNIERAELRVKSLQTTLERLQRNLTESGVQNKTSETSLNLQIENAQKTSQNAENNYKNLTDKLAQSQKDFLNSTKTSLDGILTDAEANFKAVENILNPSKSLYFNVEDLKSGLGASDSINRSHTVNEYMEYRNEFPTLKKDYEDILPLSENNVQQAVETLKNNLNKLRIFLEDVNSMINNSVPDNNLSQAQIDGYKASIANAQGMLQGDLAKTDALLQSFANFKLDRTSQLSNAENTKIIAANQLSEANNSLLKFKNDTQAGMKDMETQIQQTQNDLLSAQADLDSAKRNTVIQDSSKKLEISTLSNQVKLAENGLEDNKVESTIKGVISAVSVEVGDHVNPGTVIGKIIQNEQLKVAFYLSKESTSGVFIGQAFHFKMDEQGEDFKGFISKISPTADALNKKIMIEGVVENKALTLKPEMLVNLELDLSQKTFDAKKVYIPMNSIIFSQNVRYVYVVENNMAVRKEVEIGEIFGSWVEIVSGLAKEDKLIVEGQRNLPPAGGVKVTIIQ